MTAAASLSELHVLFAGLFHASLNVDLAAAGQAALDAGLSIDAIAEKLTHSEAFAARYDTNTADPQAFADAFAADLLGLPRGYDFSAESAVAEFRAGRDWLADQLAAGDNPALGQVACAAIRALATTTDDVFADARLQLLNEAEVSQYYVAQGGAATDLADLQAVVANVTADPASVEAAMADIDLHQGMPLNDWTVLVYMAADNDLETYALQDLNEMEGVTLPTGVNVLMGVDRRPGYDTGDGDWTDARVGTITHDADRATVGSSLVSVGEVDTGAADTLTGFINWAVLTQPARHYALVVWNHGDGIHGVGFDDSSGGDSLSPAEIRAAIDASIPGHLDFVGYDACSMSLLEQAQAAAPVADIMVAAEDQEPSAGWDYTAWLTLAFSHDGAAVDGGDLASAALAAYAGQYGGQDDTALAALDLSCIPDLEQALAAFVTASQAGASGDWQAIDAAYYAANYFGDSASVDLHGFAAVLADRNGVSSALAAAAENLVTATDIVVTDTTDNMAGTYGLSIYWPAHRPHDFADTYVASEVPLLDTVSWDAFLQDYWTFV
jgi:hypothetical protein